MRAPIVCLLLATLAGAGTAAPAPQLPVQNPGGRGGRGGPPTPPRAGTAIIVGRVLDGGSASAVSGAVVTITGSGAAPQRVQVDASGGFVFRGLPGGDFSIVAAKTGYVGGLAGQRQPNGPTRPLQLAEGEQVRDLTLRLWKAGAIGGAVIDDAGDPVVGIKVMLAERRLLNGKRQIGPSFQYSTVTTDDRGIYRFGIVAPGDYVVFARTTEEEVARGLMSLVQGDPSVIVPFAMKAMGGRPEDLINLEAALRAYPPTFHPSAPTPSAAGVVSVRSGEARLGVDIRIRLVPIVPLAGTLAGLPGPPQNNPQVTLQLPDSDGGEFEVARAIDTSNGKFTFLAVPTGKYVLRAYQSPRMQPMTTPPGAPGGTARGRAASPPPFPTEPSYWASVPLSVGTDDLRALTITMRPGARMSGRIEFEGTTPAPVREQVERTLISIIPEAVVVNVNLRTQVDADGTFSTASLPPGRYRLRVSPLATWQPKSAMTDGRDLLDDAIGLEASDVSDIVITFTDRPNAAVNGTVRQTNGTPDPDALVAIFPSDPRLRTDLSGSSRRLKLARTTKTGQFAIPGLPPGDYLIVAGGDELLDSWLEPSALQALGRRATRIQLAEGDARTQDLTNGSVR
ncbi:MAG TPA: carboxypeptidase-like regulatory domain-containing protein [Vicinamibacterales bacterium]|jgi:hypothetical protein